MTEAEERDIELTEAICEGRFEHLLEMDILPDLEDFGGFVEVLPNNEVMNEIMDLIHEIENEREAISE
jgi:hypothetical protein